MPDLALIAAWIEAVLSWGSLAEGSRGMAQFESAWLDIQARAEGRVGLNATSLPADLDQELRRQLLGPDVTDAVLGWVERDGSFSAGLAALTPQEASAFRFWLTPNDAGKVRSALEVRELMDRRRGRTGLPIRPETIEQYLSRARAKLRKLAEVDSQTESEGRAVSAAAPLAETR